MCHLAAKSPRRCESNCCHDSIHRREGPRDKSWLSKEPACGDHPVPLIYSQASTGNTRFCHLTRSGVTWGQEQGLCPRRPGLASGHCVYQLTILSKLLNFLPQFLHLKNEGNDSICLIRFLWALNEQGYLNP